jgi:aminocarboxymuconate-semialdehyde decarboxylase
MGTNEGGGTEMSNRRQFLKTLAGTTAGTTLAGWSGVELAFAGAQAAAPPAKRRQVLVAGKRVKVVDVHAHAIIPEVADLVKDTKLLRTAGPARGPQILGPDRLRVLDERGIDVQVLSVNLFWWYAAERDLAAQIVKLHDEKLSAWCAAHPDRFAALSSVALQFPDLAAEQLEQAVKNLGLRGAAIGGHVAGEPLSAPRFDPFWAKAEQLSALVFMHPGSAENVVKEDGLKGNGDLPNVVGNPLETTVFLSHIIYDGVLDRFPGLKICAAHGGGFLPSYLGRSEVACAVRPTANCQNKKHPSEYFKNQILVDSMVFSPEGLRHLVAETGPNQVVYGTDVPFNWPDTIDLVVNAPFLQAAEKEAILGGTLTKLLKL